MPRRRRYPGGVLTVRMPRTLHAELARRARLEGVSLNQWAVAALVRSLAEGDEARALPPGLYVLQEKVEDIDHEVGLIDHQLIDGQLQGNTLAADVAELAARLDDVELGLLEGQKSTFASGLREGLWEPAAERARVVEAAFARIGARVKARFAGT